MTSHDEQLDAKLQALGSALRSQPSVVNSKAIAAKQRQHPWWIASRLSLTGSGLGLAACLLIGAYLLLTVASPNSITLAQVQASLDSVPWVLIQYDDGQQRWANLRDRRCFLKSQDADGGNFHVAMRDHVAGLSWHYHTNWGQQIHEERFTPKPYPQTPWEYAVGGWDDWRNSLPDHTSVETIADTIEGQNVVRFDTYDIGPLGLRTLAQQVWADPETRLPLRIRKYSRRTGQIEMAAADFSFPETGPSSIYDLGAPEDLPVVANLGVIKPAAEAIIEAAKLAQRQLPERLCVVGKSRTAFSITWRWGNRLRSESFGLTDPTHNEAFPINIPSDVEDLHQWAKDNLTLYNLTVFDGQYEYTYNTGQAPWDFAKSPVGGLHVQRRGSDGINVLVPLRDQWPYTSNVGPMTVLENVPGIPPSCVLLRYEGLGLCRDWCIDPDRDFICVKQAECREPPEANAQIDDDYWRIERTDLRQLPTGQWYAGTVGSPNREGGTSECEVTVPSEADLLSLDADGFFDGETILRKAQDNNIPVTYWAR